MSDQQPPIERDETQPAAGGRHFGYVPDPNYTKKLNERLAADDEYQRLLAAQRAKLEHILVIFRVLNPNSDLSGPVLAAAYASAGGDLADVRRIFQIRIDRVVQTLFDAIDLIGPDDWWKPKVREIIVRAVGEAFDNAVSP